MGITDELREFMRVHHVLVGGLKELTDIADRIDAEHHKFEDKMWLKGYSECRAQLMEGNEVIASDLEKAGWVKGPLDADGEIWHSGDMSDSNWGVIEGIAYADGRWLVRGHDTSAPWIRADSVRHYHEPTVEDMLWELLGNIRPDMEDEEAVPIVKAYAEKLRLADDGKEHR